jgi:hypothetical protein
MMIKGISGDKGKEWSKRVISVFEDKERAW